MNTRKGFKKEKSICGMNPQKCLFLLHNSAEHVDGVMCCYIYFFVLQSRIDKNTGHILLGAG